MRPVRNQLLAEFLEKTKKRLVAEEKRLVEDEKRLREEDPFLVPGRDVGNPEFMGEAGEEIGHTRVEAESEMVKRRLADTRLALTKLETGKYGICERCGEHIDRARLEVFPQARYCVDCEKKNRQSGS